MPWANYETILKCYLLPEFGYRDINAIGFDNVTDFLGKLHAQGKSHDLLNRIGRTLKALLFFALERKWIESNPLQRFRVAGGSEGRAMNRGTFDETELRAILEAAPERARPLFAMLAYTGIRPGEAYALRWQDLNLDRASMHICRSWGDRESTAVGTKTKGVRTIAIPGILIPELKDLQEATGGTDEQLVFGTRNGQPLSGSNVLNRWWYPTLAKAGVRRLDLYSLRHTFASIARSADVASFLVSRAMGHATSGLVDRVYADALPSGMAHLAERVAERVQGTKAGLRVIHGGKPQSVRQPLDESPSGGSQDVASG